MFRIGLEERARRGIVWFEWHNTAEQALARVGDLLVYAKHVEVVNVMEIRTTPDDATTFCYVRADQLYPLK